MDVPTSEVDYISATTVRGDHEVHKGHVVALGKKMITLRSPWRNILIFTYVHIMQIHFSLLAKQGMWQLIADCEFWFRFRVRPCEICGRGSCAENRVFSEYFSFPQSFIAPHLSILTLPYSEGQANETWELSKLHFFRYRGWSVKRTFKPQSSNSQIITPLSYWQLKYIVVFAWNNE
jgi:hypothetical protein